MEYKQRGDLFSFDLLKCLRTAYFHNDCQLCLEACPHEAFFFDRRRLTVDFEKCTNCGVCLGICPTEALSLDFFDPNEYILKQKDDEVLLSCKKDLPCLGSFDSEHYITLLLQKEKVACDVSHCEGCELNPDNKTFESIQERIGEANKFVKELGFDKEIENATFEPDRRGFFKSFFSATKELSQEESLKDLKQQVSKVPTKQLLLKNALKKCASSIQNPLIKTDYHFLATKKIEESCNNCGECVQFCPTKALFFAKEGTAIWFIAGNCIACEICNDLCKPRSIVNKKEIDIISWAFDRGEELIEHQLEICIECKTPFPYKGGEMICDRCQSFVSEFGDIFKLASEE